MSLSFYTVDDYIRILRENYEKIMIETIDKLISDEWIASYNYYVGVYTARERYDAEIVRELKHHRDEEIKHGDMLGELLHKRFNTGPRRNIEDLVANSNCGNDPTRSADLLVIAEEQRKGEICAIKHYKEAISIAKIVGDAESAKVFEEILNDEIEHRNDLSEFIAKLKGEV